VVALRQLRPVCTSTQHIPTMTSWLVDAGAVVGAEYGEDGVVQKNVGAVDKKQLIKDDDVLDGVEVHGAGLRQNGRALDGVVGVPEETQLQVEEVGEKICDGLASEQKQVVNGRLKESEVAELVEGKEANLEEPLHVVGGEEDEGGHAEGLLELARGGVDVVLEL